MSLYKIQIDSRNYDVFTIINATTLEAVIIDKFNPAEHKLFTNDVFKYDNGKVELVSSVIRNNENIPAVLILSDNKTYGRQHKSKDGQTYTKKRLELTLGKLLYKCIPDDKSLPAFLVPYEIKQMDFSKVLNNLYVTIKYDNWTDKHPRAVLTQTIGSVDILHNFYEYQLYCKNLNVSINKFDKETNKVILSKSSDNESIISLICQNYDHLEDRTSWKTFTIDPDTSLDYDDGFSIKKLDNNQTLLSIYIANVTIWLDFLNLWSVFSERISTIYLPTNKKPMLPKILSDYLCSLMQGKRRIAFVMDTIIDETGTIVSTSYTNAVIQVFKNYAYEEAKLIRDKDYVFLLKIVRQMSLQYKYTDNILDSHDVVSYLMIFMNNYCAKDLCKYRNGIFRSVINSEQLNLPNDLPNDVYKFIGFWNNSSAQYTTTCIRHDSLNMDEYIHITSPIRRIVDLLNMIKFQQNHSLLTLSPSASEFYDKWINKLAYINDTMKSIRKVQNVCDLLDKCSEKINNVYDGYCFNKLDRQDGLYEFTVFIPEIKLATKVKVNENMDNYVKRQYKLFMFSDEETFNRKIRVQLI